jgi:hypothetical protein
VLAVAACVLSLAGGPAQAAEGSVGLGTAGSFAVLAGTTVTNTGPSVISGDVGVSPGTAVTGFAPVEVTNGTIHRADAVAAKAQSDTTIAYNDAAGRTTSETVTADLAGQNLSPGVYTGPTLALNGTLTLDAHGDPNAVYVFKAGSTLKTGSGSAVLLVNGADPCNVFWQVGSSATLGTTTSFAGTVLALASITAKTNATVAGRLLARNGAVTLDTNTITSTECSTPGSTGGSGGTTAGSTGGTTSGGTTAGSTGGTTSGGTTAGTGGTTSGETTAGTGGTTSGETTAGAGGTTAGGSTGTGTTAGGGTGTSGSTTGTSSGATTSSSGSGSDTVANGTSDSNADAIGSNGAFGLPFTGAPISLLLLIGVIATVLGFAGLRAGRRRLPVQPLSGEHRTPPAP